MLTLLSFAAAIAGLACFLWPSLRRLSGRTEAAPAGAGATIRSPLWWAGFLLTALAIMLQRAAAGSA
jgi:hypothetical protein